MMGASVAVSIAHMAVPNRAVKRACKRHMFTVGKAMTLGMTGHPVTSAIWERSVEPLVVDLLENTAYGILHGMIPGLRSDNTGGKKPIDDDLDCDEEEEGGSNK